MKYPWIDEYLMARRGVTKDLQAEWNWIRYHVGGKMFAAVLLDDHNQPRRFMKNLGPFPAHNSIYPAANYIRVCPLFPGRVLPPGVRLSFARLPKRACSSSSGGSAVNRMICYSSVF